MSNYVSKKELINKIKDRLKKLPESRVELGGYHAGKADAYQNVIDDIQSGKFDATVTDDQLEAIALRSYDDFSRYAAKEILRLRSALERIANYECDQHESDLIAYANCKRIAIEAISTGEFQAMAWKRITDIPNDLRCLVSDGEQIAMGGYLGGSWYADDFSSVLSEEITHYLIVNLPMKEDNE
nr:hypothetical protein [Aneurinibacillus sp. XH2]